MIRGIILDIDGTLILSNDAHAQAWVDAFAEFGRELAYDQVRPLIGMGGDKLLARVAPGLSEEEGEGKQISERRREIFLERYAPSLESAPGSRELVQRMRHAGLHLMVGTSAKQQELDALLKAAHVEDLLTEMTTSDEVEQSKPAPDVVTVALDKLHLAAGEVIMIGDTPYDIESAGRSKVGTIAVRCGGWDDGHLGGALAIYDDPADLLAHFDESPLTRS